MIKIKLVGTFSISIILSLFMAHVLQPVSAQVAPCNGPGEFVRGIDRITGEPVCGRVTGCPYGDSIPLGDECTRAGISQGLLPVVEPPVPTPPVIDEPVEDVPSFYIEGK